MRIKLLFLFLFPLFVFAQKTLRDSIYIKTNMFEIVYSEKLQQPKFIRYTVQCPNGEASRKGMDFYTCDSILTSDNKDYESNPYDKGHLAPAADFNCDREMLYKTFSYLNCTLQHEKLNRVHWRLLEDYERLLAYTEGPVFVEIKVIFDKNPKRVSTGAAIPTAFRKTIKTKNKTLKFYFKNEPPTKPTFMDYQVK